MVVIPEPCKELSRRPQIVLVGIVSYEPSSTQVLIVAQLYIPLLHTLANEPRRLADVHTPPPKKEHIPLITWVGSQGNQFHP